MYESSRVNKTNNLDKEIKGIFEQNSENTMIGDIDNIVSSINPRNSSKALEKIEAICNQFHQFAQQIRSCYDEKTTLAINDEYDVQDLFYSLLTLYFSDIRREEYIPSFAGANSRADFFLKQEKILIEIKKTRAGLTNKKLGDELIIDINKYQAHPDCKALTFFVYDPESRIDNPKEFEEDLEIRSRNINVKVFIRP